MEYESYQRSKAAQRRKRRKTQRILRISLVVAVLLILSGLLTLLFSIGNKKPKPEPEAAASTVSVLAPLPFGGKSPTDSAEETEAVRVGPVQQTENIRLTEHDFSNSALPECGIVTTEYFSDAAFLGDSITQGFIEYDFDLSGALVCGYVGTSPVNIVNGTTMTHSQRGDEVPMEVLTDARPKKLYILMGANLLVTQGIDDNFIAYYGQMLDMLRERLPDTIIYVQSLLPVRPEVTEQKPGLDNERFRTLNGRLQQLADERGLCYINLQEAFADADGNLKEQYANGDGIHLNISGYQAWINYLCRHTRYDPQNPWLPGSTYFRSNK